MLDAEIRAEARRAARNASREMLLEILTQERVPRGPGSPIQPYAVRRLHIFALSAARQELVNRYACSDCGAVAGRECKPDYGCTDRSRERVAGVRALRV